MKNINLQKSTYVIKRLGTNNLGDLEKLHTYVYNKPLSSGFFQKKYNTTFAGTEYIGFIAYNNDLLPIAYYGVIPCFIQYESQTILSAQAADAMTHPAYRNKGLFTELVILTCELCLKENIVLIFGFPNQNSFPGFINKLSWHTTERMDCFIIPVNTLPLEKISSRLPLLKSLYAWYTRQVLKKYLASQQENENSMLKEGYNGVFRDDAYLKYKTYSATRIINIRGTRLWIKISNGIMIGDISGPGETFGEVMNRLTGIARKLGVNQVQFHTSPDTKLHTLFKKHYKSISSFPVIFKIIKPGISINNIKFTFADIDIF